jgi:hypothetical protein
MGWRETYYQAEQRNNSPEQQILTALRLSIGKGERWALPDPIPSCPRKT